MNLIGVIEVSKIKAELNDYQLRVQKSFETYIAATMVQYDIFNFDFMIFRSAL